MPVRVRIQPRDLYYIRAMLKIMETIQQQKGKIEFNFAIFLFLLLSADVIFMFMHVYYKLTHDMECSLFCLTTDRGYAEFFQYLKYSWIMILLAYIILITKTPQYLSWILLFAFFLLNDAFQLHRLFGSIFSRKFVFDPPMDLRRADVGTFVYFIVCGLALMGLIFWTYLRGDKNYRKNSIDIGFFVLLVFFFGAVVDIIPGAFSLNGMGLSFFEEAGEMVIMSLVLWYVYMIAVCRGAFYLNIVGLIRGLFSRSERTSSLEP
jgi:hypothetical protein